MRVMTADSVALANALAWHDAAWGTKVSPIGDWFAVLCGPGFYVNRLEGGGLDRPLVIEEVVEFEALADEVGVAPAIAVVDVGDPGTAALLAERGYEPDGAVSVGVVRLDSSRTAFGGDGFLLETVVDDAGLTQWQRSAAAGWGHATAEARHTSDEFARAAYHASGSTLMLVRDLADSRVVATCSLSVRAGVATLGGMSVVPTERRRGVQAAAIELRLDYAQRAGCDVAVTSTEVGGDSERNVRRRGFELSHTIVTWAGPPRPENPV